MRSETLRLAAWPGDVLKMHVEVTRARGDIFKFKGQAKVNGKVCAEAEFAAMSADAGK